MQKPAKQALAFWLIAAALILLVLFSVLGAPRTPDGAGEAVGRVLAQTGLAALLAWWLARRRNPPWSWLRFGAVYVIAVVALGLLAAMGRARADEALPFTAAFAQDWTVEQRAGVSSAAQELTHLKPESDRRLPSGSFKRIGEDEIDQHLCIRGIESHAE